MESQPSGILLGCLVVRYVNLNNKWEKAKKVFP
jgi:hypothetical protein